MSKKANKLELQKGDHDTYIETCSLEEDNPLTVKGEILDYNNFNNQRRAKNNVTIKRKRKMCFNFLLYKKFTRSIIL